jgi:hypothetical protein
MRMQLRVLRLTGLRSIWRGWMLLALIGILFNWLALAGDIPSLGIIASSVAHAVEPLSELLLVLAVISMLIGTILYNMLGHELEKWSSTGAVAYSMMRHFIIGVQPA